MKQHLRKPIRSNQLIRSILLKLNIDKFGNEIIIEWEDPQCKYIIEIGHSHDTYWCKFEINLYDWIYIHMTCIGYCITHCYFQDGNRVTYDYINNQFVKECQKVRMIEYNLIHAIWDSFYYDNIDFPYEYLYEDAV